LSWEKRRARQLLDREWEGLPRRFFRARQFRGGALQAYLGDAYDFVRFIEFVDLSPGDRT
jgi:hypothetical protein